MTLSQLRAAATRTVFRNFFASLLFCVSAAQWAMLWWLLWPAASTPLWVHVVAVGAIHGFNRRLTGGLARRAARHPVRRVYEATAFTSLFCAIFLLLTFVAREIAHLFVGTVLAAVQTAPDVALTANGVDGAFAWLRSVGVGLIVVFAAYGYTIGQARLKVTRLRLPLRNFETLPELRIAQISDIHVGQNLTRAQLTRFVERVNDLDADIVCVTGDIADNARSDMALFFPILGQLRAKRAVIAILGNHDHYAGAARVEEALHRHTDFIVLRDGHVTLDIEGTPLHVIGLDDRGLDWARGVREVPYLASTHERIPPGDAVLVLCHRPDIFAQTAELGIGLTLSGHTHGGQVAIPAPFGKALSPARVVTRYDRGVFGNGGSFLYVNSGIGVTAQRLRLCTPREISVFEVGGGCATPLTAVQ